MIEEIWKDVIGYEAYYQISNMERIKTLWGRMGVKFLTPHKDSKGYLIVTLCNKEKRKRHFLHRIIAEAFIPNPENKPFVNHKNGIKTDNSIYNLGWCTVTENNIHARMMGLNKVSDKHIELLKINKIRSKLVLNTCTGIYYNSVLDALDSLPCKNNRNYLYDRLGGRYKNNTDFIYA